MMALAKYQSSTTGAPEKYKSNFAPHALLRQVIATVWKQQSFILLLLRRAITGSAGSGFGCYHGTKLPQVVHCMFVGKQYVAFVIEVAKKRVECREVGVGGKHCKKML